MTDHPSAETRRLYARGLLNGRSLLEVDDHIAACDACREAMSRSLATVADSVRDAIAGEHLDYERMEAYVDHAADREEVERHLRLCPMCASEVEDLRRARSELRPQRWTWWAAAAAIVLVIGAAALLRQPPPQPEPAPVRRLPVSRPPQIQPLRSLDPALADVLAQLAAGVLPSAKIIDEFGSQTERTRGGDEETHPLTVLAPLGVIEESRPMFRWTARPGATYVVEVFDGSYRRLARGDAVRRDGWQPRDPLPRGAVYSWQVTATRGTEQITAPAPPAPPARFRIIGDAAVAEIGKARAANDHLAAALVYAREGALDRAIEEMTLAQAEQPQSADIRAALETLRRVRAGSSDPA